MPLVMTRGAASTRGFGTFNKGIVLAPSTAVTFVAANASTGASSSTTYNLISGYSAGIYLYLVGDGSQSGFTCCGNCGRSSSGEFVQYAYTCTGSETSITITWNANGALQTNNRHQLVINGGSNNGKAAYAGSYAPLCGYGNSATPTSQRLNSNAVFSVVSWGAYADSSGNYYDDDYFYSACGGPQGAGNNGANLDGQYLGYGGDCGAGARGGFWIQYRNNY